jgi:hypothetical protein
MHYLSNNAPAERTHTMLAAKLLAALGAHHEAPGSVPHAKRVRTSPGNEPPTLANASIAVDVPHRSPSLAWRDEPIVISSDDDADETRGGARATRTRETLRRHAASLRNTRRTNARLAQHAETLLFVDYTLMYEQAVEFVLEQHSSYFETLVPVPRHRISADARYRTRVMDGDTVLANIEADFDNFPMKRSYLQRIFHKLLCNVLAPLVYRQEWRDNRLAIMAKNQWQDVSGSEGEREGSERKFIFPSRCATA